MKKETKLYKLYEIEYTLSNGEWCQNQFTGINKNDAIKDFIRWTCRPKSSIISIESI